MQTCDVAVIGAGPYGLSAAAHLRQVDGLDLRIFGEPMSFWQNHMPEGMILRSPREASHIADLGGHLKVESYEKAMGGRVAATPPPQVTSEIAIKSISKQLSLQNFVDYGLWFMRQAGLSVDRRAVRRIERESTGYRLILEKEEDLIARRVVVAAGIQFFAHIPKIFEGLPEALVSHTSAHKNLAQFRGKKILIIGAGQSALESAALCHEGGALVEVLVREPQVRWLGQRPWMHKGLLGKLLYGRADVGPAGVSQLVQRPNLFRLLPRSIQDRWEPRAIRAAGSNWVKERVPCVPIRTNTFVERASIEGEGLRVRLNDGSDTAVDHILLGTGYRVDIAKYPFLSPAVLERVRQVNGFPRLNWAFESTSTRLHFVGAPAAWSFGPLMRFVAGTEFSSPTLLRGILRQDRSSLIRTRSASAEVVVNLPAGPGER